MNKNQQDFINKILPGAIETYKKYDINIVLSLVQAIHESNWGASELATKANNLFGIKYHVDNKYGKYEIYTDEWIDGIKKKVKTYFKKYTNWNQSIDHHGEYLATRKIDDKLIYSKVISAKDDYKTAIKEVHKAKYATDPGYTNKLLTLVDEYKLYEYDIIIAIDDGHGLETAGKRSPDGYRENIFNHYTKEFLKIELKAQGFKVVDCSPTRSDNSLQNRCDIANNGNADVFVSIHFNAMGSNWQTSAEGIETYYHGGSVKGKKLATLVHKRLMQGTKMNNRGVKADTTIYSSGFAVLRNTNMPAILTECGFMDNKDDRILMASTTYRQECAKEICQGICDYFGKTYKEEKGYTGILLEAYNNHWFTGKDYELNTNVDFSKLCWILKQFDENYLNKKYQKK